jgi:diguanylate cyclase (GGDEF)-like protein
MDLLAGLEKRSKLFWTIIGYALITVVGFVDYLTGYEISFSLFYLIPISLLAWFAGRRFGIAAAIASALVWLLADISTGQVYSHPGIYYWNSSVRFSFFIIVTLLITAVARMLEREKEFANIDHLTGAVNLRNFCEILQGEIERANRYKHPFSLAYLDLDNFKAINDQFGHSVGDKVLAAVVGETKQLLRKTDTVARLGGDEFAFLLPESDQKAARSAISKIHYGLIEAMGRKQWPVTFSIGVMTFMIPPDSADEAVKLADDLMYAVKDQGKNATIFSSYPHEYRPDSF